MEGDRVPAWWFWLFVVAFGVTFLLYAVEVFEHSSCVLDYEACVADYNVLWEDYSRLYSKYQHLRASYEQLYYEYNVLYADYNYYYSLYEDLRERYNELYDRVLEYTAKIDFVYSWISENSSLSDSVFEREVHGCVSGRYVNYPCVLWRRRYVYISDISDELLSPLEFIRRGGGDCEDFSFYAMALLRTAMEKGYCVKFFASGSGKFFLDSQWYYPDSEEVVVCLEDVNVVCGPVVLGDIGEEHCLLRVRGNGGKVYYVEPQSGMVEEFNPVLEDDFFAPGLVVVDRTDLSGWYREVLSLVEVS